MMVLVSLLQVAVASCAIVRVRCSGLVQGPSSTVNSLADCRWKLREKHLGGIENHACLILWEEDRDVGEGTA